MFKTLLFAAAASLSLSSAALASNNNGNNNQQPSASVTNNPTFNNDPRATASVVAPVTNTNVIAPVTTSGAQAGALAGALSTSESASHSASSSAATLNGAVSGKVDTSITNSPVVAPVFNGPAVSISSPKQFRSAPDVGAPIAINVASCAMADGLSVSFPGGGGNVTKSKVDPDCNDRADAALLFSFGEREAAVARMYGHDNAGAINIGRGLNADGSPR